MRLRKGEKVEVLTQKEVPSGSWHCAEIIDANSHYYTVRYDSDIGSTGFVEKVCWKLVRPRPPVVDVLDDWVPGDVVEVFHNFSWKMATVLKVSRWDRLSVRLLGSSMEMKVSKVDVRARLCWQDGEWGVIGKASSKHEDTRFRLPSTRTNNSNQPPKTGPTTNPHTKLDPALDTPYIPTTRIKKRKPSHYPELKPYSQHNHRMRLIESNHHETVSSSVGSCSSEKWHQGITTGQYESTDSHCSDAESFCLRSEGAKWAPPSKEEEVTEEVHKLEVHAYRCIIGAFHASGPLNWEQELLLTNLRESLHISNDEHLSEIRNLVSSNDFILSC